METLKLFPEEPGMTRASDYPRTNSENHDHLGLDLTLTLAPPGSGHNNSSEKVGPAITLVPPGDQAGGSQSNKRMKKCSGDGGGSGGSSKQVGPVPAPGLPSAMRRRVESRGGGKNVRLILQKPLYPSDTNPIENRLSMPVQQLVAGEFLSAAEEKKCRRKRDSSGLIEGVRASVLVEPRLGGDNAVDVAYMAHLRKWGYTSSRSYVLCGSWNNIVAESGFVTGQVVQVWFFRDVDGNPCFALVNLDKQ